jgi:hypothetical protein
MPTFRIRDLIVAVGLGRRAAAPGQPDQPAPPPGPTPKLRTHVEPGGGCLTGTHALYVCLERSVPNCIMSNTQVALCHAPSIMPNCITTPEWYAFDRTHRVDLDPIPCMSADELALLKRQLSEVMQVIEQREDALHHGAVDIARDPQTIAEVADLEAKLKDALEALERRRTELLRNRPG